MAPSTKLLTTAGKVSIFGWLDKIPIWDNLPYPIKGSLLRALKVGLSGAIAVLVTAASAGTLFPAAWGPQVAVLLTAALNATDKYIREWNIDKGIIPVAPEPQPEIEKDPVVEEPDDPVLDDTNDPIVEPEDDAEEPIFNEEPEESVEKEEEASPDLPTGN